jgi:hypothetical protein
MLLCQADEHAEKDVHKQDKADQAGDFVNMEVSLAYMAIPKKKGQAIHTDNAHLMLEFFVGKSEVTSWAPHGQ